jgi:hypothetical protein
MRVSEPVPVVFGPVRIHKVEKVALVFGLFYCVHCIKASSMTTAKNETAAVYIIRCNFLQILKMCFLSLPTMPT